MKIMSVMNFTTVLMIHDTNIDTKMLYCIEYVSMATRSYVHTTLCVLPTGASFVFLDGPSQSVTNPPASQGYSDVT